MFSVIVGAFYCKKEIDKRIHFFSFSLSIDNIPNGPELISTRKSNQFLIEFLVREQKFYTKYVLFRPKSNFITVFLPLHQQITNLIIKRNIL